MKRDKYVDIVKGICILSVVFVHINIISKQYGICVSYIQNFIYQFYLSTFFIVTGLYLKNLKSPKEFFNQKIKKWYIKLMLYYIPFVLLHNLFITIGIYDIGKMYGGKVTQVYSEWQVIQKVIETLLLMGREPLLGTMWFFISQIIALIGLSVISYVIDKIANKYHLGSDKIIFVVLLVLLFISTSLTEIFSITIPRISNSISAMILIYIGYYFKQVLELKYDNILIFLISIIGLICNTIFVGRIDLNVNKIINPVTFIASSVAGMYAL